MSGRLIVEPDFRPSPSPTYYFKQVKLRESIANGPERKSLGEEMRRIFVTEWRLSKARNSASYEIEMDHELMQDLRADHVEWYTRFSDLVMVTQPYLGDYEIGSMPKLEVKTIAEEMQAKLSWGAKVEARVIIANDWAYYYPGSATMLIIFLPAVYSKLLRLIARAA